MLELPDALRTRAGLDVAIGGNMWEYYGKPGKWIAVISVNKTRYHLGVFKTAKEAAKAYNQAALKYHGKFARLNEV